MRQIRTRRDGDWHRPALGATDKTACGEKIGGAFASRDYELDGELCKLGCWTRPERDTAKDLAAAAAAAREFEEQPTDIEEAPPEVKA